MLHCCELAAAEEGWQLAAAGDGWRSPRNILSIGTAGPPLAYEKES